MVISIFEQALDEVRAEYDSLFSREALSLILLSVVTARAALAVPEGEERAINTAVASGAKRIIQFDAPPLHIPDATDGSFKTEVVWFDDPNVGTIKVNYWHGPDPRSTPHDHPWEEDDISFKSLIVKGGYTESVYSNTGEFIRQTTYEAGDVNTVGSDEFHTVDTVQPGTVSIMFCGPRRIKPWGYVIDGEFAPPSDPRVSDDTFRNKMWAINPHKRPTS
jgi:hypothetical protein